MRSSLTVGGIEVALSVQSASLEAVIARHYAPYLGPPENPVATVRFELAPNGDPALAPPVALFADHGDVPLGRSTLPAEVEFGALTVIRTTPTAWNLDRALQTLFAMLAPPFGGLLVNGCGVIMDRTAHVLLGGSDVWRSTLAARAGRRPLLMGACVMVHQVGGRWMAASTPFRAESLQPPRMVPLKQLWVASPGPFTRRASAENPALAAALDAAMPSTDAPSLRLAASSLFTRMVSAVPLGVLPSLSPARIWEEISDGPGPEEDRLEPEPVA